MTIPVPADDFLVYGRDWWIKPVPYNPFAAGFRIAHPYAPIVTEGLAVEVWIKAIVEIVRPLRQHDFYTSELMDRPDDGATRRCKSASSSGMR